MASKTPSDWLSQFFSSQSREVDGPDGRPLYGYQIQTEEFEGLGKLLEDCLVNRSGPSRYKFNTESIFVLYAAEWWRRKYEGGSWKWEDVFTSINWPNQPPSKRQQLTTKGLRYWKREVYQRQSGYVAYLMSLVTEGGFPIRLVERSNTHLSRYLRAVLSDFAKYRNAGISSLRVAESHGERLPATFRKPAVFRLAADTIEAILDLADKVNDGADPYSELERRDPSWKAKLPLAVEEAGARSLVNGLLRSAKSNQEQRSERICFRRQFVPRDSYGFIHQGLLELPQELDVGRVAAQIDVEAASLPRRIELSVAHGAEFTKVATLAREGEKYFVYPYSPESLKFPIPAGRDIACILTSLSQGRLGELPITGSEGLDEDLPVVCYEDDGAYNVLGQGGLRTRLEMVFIGMPMTMSVNTSIPAESWSPFEAIEDDRSWILATDSVLLDSELGFRCSVRLREPAETSSDCLVVGKRAWLNEISGSRCYLGFPSIFQLSDTKLVRVTDDDIFWSAPRRGSGWKAISSVVPCGAIRVRVIVDGNCLYAGRFSVLPEDFKTEIVTGASQRSGEVLIDGVPDARLGLECNPLLDAVVSTDGETQRLLISSSEPYSGKVSINLVWEDASAATIVVPFPGEGASFVDNDGATIQRRVISLSTLTRASAIAVTHLSRRQFVVFAELRANDIDTRLSRSIFRFERFLNEVSGGYFELRLLEIFPMVRDLFSYSAQLDAIVRLEILMTGRAIASVDVYQFDSRLKFDPATCAVQHEIEADTEDWHTPALHLVQLAGDHSPDVESSVLTESGNIGWRIEDDGIEPFACLAIARGPKQKSVRPCVVFGSVPPSWDCEEGKSPSLDQIALHRCEQDRRRLLERYLQELIAEPTSLEWNTLLTYVRRYSDVHPDAVDLYSALIDNEEACARLFVMSAEQDIQLFLDWQDFLPFRWWQIPLHAFESAIDAYRRFVERHYSDYAHELYLRAIRQFDRLARDVDPFETLAQILFYQEPGERNAERASGDARERFKLSLNGTLRTELISRHGDSKWPIGLDRENWHHILKVQLPWLDDGGARHRRTFLDAVVAQAYCIVDDRYLDRSTRATVGAIRQFDVNSFDMMLSAAIHIFRDFIDQVD